MTRRTIRHTLKRRYRGGHWFKTRPVSKSCQWMPWSRNTCCTFQFKLEKSIAKSNLTPHEKQELVKYCRSYFEKTTEPFCNKRSLFDKISNDASEFVEFIGKIPIGLNTNEKTNIIQFLNSY